MASGPILEPGERILWQGRPSGGIHLRWRNWFTLVMGLFFAGAALNAPSRRIALIQAVVAVALVLVPLVIEPWLRRRTSYVLTDRRAMIRRDLPLWGRGTDSYPVTQGAELTLKPGDPGTVWFASRMGWSNVQPVKRIGFEFIPDADHVFGLMTRRKEPA